MNADVALGVKVFSRTKKLARLLNSVPDWVSAVYIADDGEKISRKKLYKKSRKYDLKIINLEYDVGVGKGRNAIVNAVEEEYIFICDPDHIFPSSARILYDQLSTSPEFGGISGLIVEPDNDRLYSQAADFTENQTDDGTKLVRRTYSSGNHKMFKIRGNAPLVKFDFIPQATLFRTDCLIEQPWDPKYITEFEHTDFYLSHWKNTDWNFGICPSVQVPHYPGGDTDYILNRNDPMKKSVGKKYFLDKWDYVELETTEGRWIEAGSLGGISESMMTAINILEQEGSASFTKRLWVFLRNKIIDRR